MSEQLLLATKLAIPPVRSDVVPRPRLTSQLQLCAQRPLTLIAAPAGFGKTTLLSTWFEHAPIIAAWVSLESGDDDLTRFWSYVFTALERVLPGSGASALALLQGSTSQQPTPIEAILTVWINGLAALSQVAVLILDDYHQVTAQSVHRSVTYLVDHLPHQLHLVITTRADPPLPLARLRTRGHLTEIRVADLRFTAEETATFLTRTLGLELSSEDISALGARTEGWIAGLQLAGLSMQGRPDISDFIKAFTGSHRYIIDYLAEEVLARQAEPVQTFLLQTSILERLEGSLCEAVMGKMCEIGSADSGQAMLEQLEQANLFLTPLDDERRWYRYHQLFAEALRHRLQRQHPTLVPELHRRASVWYEEWGLLNEAVHHALTASDFEQAARLIEHAGLSLVRRGELTILQQWLAALPTELVRSRIELAIFQGWLLFVTGKHEAAEQHLQEIERSLSASHESVELPEQGSIPRGAFNVTTVRGRVAAIRASIAVAQSDVARTIALSRLALDYLPRESMARAYAALYLGRAYWLSGDVSTASMALTEAVHVGWEVNHPYSVFLVIYELAHVQIQQGQLHQADQTYRQALQQALERGGPQPALGPAYVGSGNLEREWNQLDAAVFHLQEGIKLCEQTYNMWAIAQAYIGWAFINQARGDANNAQAMMRQAVLATERQSLSQFRRAQVMAWQAWLSLRQGDEAAVRRWVQHCGLSMEQELNHIREREYLTLVRVLIAQRKLAEAGRWLSTLLQLAETQGRKGSIIEILMLRAEALYASDEVDQALEQLSLSLSMAEPEGYIRLYVDEREPMADMLVQMRSRTFTKRPVSSHYREQLLAVLSPTHDGDVPTDSANALQPGVQPLSEPLSERELEVLRLIIAGCSNREIADRLVIAVSTVKWHVNTIYAKLQVDSRTKAVARARELNIG